MALFGLNKKKSNEELVEEILLENYNKYYRLAYGYVHNEADAGDIVQNGAYKALRSCGSLRNQEFAATWVYRIMLNEVFAFLRQPKPQSYDWILQERGDLEKGAEDTYQDVDLYRALDTLSDTEKAIVIMRYFEDRKLEEISEILGENLSTVKSKLYRAMRKLRERLEAHESKHIEYGRVEAGEQRGYDSSQRKI